MLSRVSRCGISYVPDAYGRTTHGIVGRQSAGREFLRAFALAKRAEGYRCVAATPDDFSAFCEQIAEFGGDPAAAYHIGVNDIDAIARLGTLYWPDPVLGRLAWMRRSLRDDAYSLCGVTHTLSESGVIAGLQDLLVAPLQPWDALVCTSQAARRSVRAILDDFADYLEERTGARSAMPAQLPVIPLGVDAARFERTDARAAAGRVLRRQLGIADSAVVGLYFGRFNFLTKAHPTPLFMAFREAAAATPGVDLHLLMAGQFVNPLVEAEFRALAQAYCGDVPISWIDGRDPASSEASWAAADLFVSLPDNLQETFGMTVLEAMAASLPCVVSDWSGLRESVVDGETGYVVPTCMPSARESDMVLTRAAFGVESFDDSIAALNQVVAVDIGVAARRIAALAASAELRRRLGRAGLARVVGDYDWTAILAQYQALWDELAAIRLQAARSTSGRPPLTQFGLSDPFHAFGHFATAQLAPTSVVRCVAATTAAQLTELRAHPSHAMLLPLLLTPADLAALVAAIARNGSATVIQLETAFGHLRREKVALSLLWLFKFGVVNIEY
ncbi:glycosyltransferase family 4 protein [Bradyrhizobium sp. 2TAF24]|uniref:glycosyltransferase family 4 protein n=1 Tax=Bradyrhizobium sp. 2TAF24 TaxID=3233011 RepID=UPI003F911656